MKCLLIVHFEVPVSARKDEISKQCVKVMKEMLRDESMYKITTKNLSAKFQKKANDLVNFMKKEDQKFESS